MAETVSQHKDAPDESRQQLEQLMLQKRMEDIGKKLLVLSGKGGVGKSTVAANLAVSLSNRGKHVGLLDIDVHGPSIPKLMGLEGRTIETADGLMKPVRVNDNLTVMSIGFMLKEAADAVIWRGPLKYSMIRQFLKDVAWGRLDYLVVDSPPGTGDEPLSVAQLVGSPAGAIVVTTGQDLAISDVRRSIGFCRALSLPVVGVVENMSGFVCPNCGVSINLFGAGGGKSLAAEMEVPFLGTIPIDPAIVTSGDGGLPFITDNRASDASRAFEEIVEKIETDDADRN